MRRETRAFTFDEGLLMTGFGMQREECRKEQIRWGDGECTENV
jgi:hypothetical protein